jgi:hypothetical protein
MKGVPSPVARLLDGDDDGQLLQATNSIVLSSKLQDYRNSLNVRLEDPVAGAL